VEKLARFTRVFGIVFIVGGSIGVSMGLLHARAAAHAPELSFADQARISAAGTTEAMWNALVGLVPGVGLLVVSAWAKRKLAATESEQHTDS
jgi:hypothetical protein